MRVHHDLHSFPTRRSSDLIWEQALGPEHPEVAFPLHNLANLYLEQGKYEQAEPLFLHALQIREQTLGPEHPKVADPLDGLAEDRKSTRLNSSHMSISYAVF